MKIDFVSTVFIETIELGQSKVRTRTSTMGVPFCIKAVPNKGEVFQLGAGMVPNPAPGSRVKEDNST